MRGNDVALAALALLAACGGDRQRPEPEAAWSPGGTRSVVRTTSLEAGQSVPNPAVRNPYADDPRTIAEGRRLYESFNCAGCHGSAGGGGIGPPFADDVWIYGSEPENIFQAVTQGRPNGMPVYGEKIPEESLWQIVAYVRSLRPPDAGGGAAGAGPLGDGATGRVTRGATTAGAAGGGVPK